MVVGVIGSVTGLSAEQVARLVAYDDAQTVAWPPSSCCPSIRPTRRAGWPACRSYERLVTDVAPLTSPTDIPRTGRRCSTCSPSTTPTREEVVPCLNQHTFLPAGSLRAGRHREVLVDRAVCRELANQLRLGVITNDIYTDEDARLLRSAGVLEPERIRAVETGACPHTAIRDDVTPT